MRGTKRNQETNKLKTTTPILKKQTKQNKTKKHLTIKCDARTCDSGL